MNNDFGMVWSIANSFVQREFGVGNPITRPVITHAAEKALEVTRAMGLSVSLEQLVAELEASWNVWIGRSVTLEDNKGHVPWLDQRKGAIQWGYWRRYHAYLVSKGWAGPSIAKLDDTTDETLSRLEDPQREGSWDRRGLVVGHVQSGKTANYTGLIAKAADAGYRVIVVLAGIHNGLRSQTQIRLDEGFVGYDSKRDVASGASRPIGVGRIAPSLRPNTITTRMENGDFAESLARSFRIAPGEVPLLFVVKKNAKVLKNVNAWVETFATKTLTSETGERKVVPTTPLLVIDDEADNASVDTRLQTFDENGKPDEAHDPTAINWEIRRLLHLFERAAYVGYTATPFANIFIHQSGATPEVGEDLFPRSFIASLPAASDYVGPARVFGIQSDSQLEADSVKPLGLVRHVDGKDDGAADAKAWQEEQVWMPAGHKKDHKPHYCGEARVPPSVQKAIRSFVLASAARLARGQHKVHNSMLIHVTRFTDVQEEVARQVEEELKLIKAHLAAGEGAGIRKVHEELRTLWEADFVLTTQRLEDPSLPVLSWDEVRKHLKTASDPIKVMQVNGTAKDALDYEEYKEVGLNVIAVGGDKLARGLTLEGLSVSYFLRASKMYDTLMQMGRWFGYRPGYLDLCRLFMPRELNTWFQHIAMANEELRQEFDRMATVGGTPEDYGLRVRSHPTLLVTSRVKMRHGTALQISYAGTIQETSTFDISAATLKNNAAAADALVNKLQQTRLGRTDWVQGRGKGNHKWNGTYVWIDVGSDRVVGFFRALKGSGEATSANEELIAKYIERQQAGNELTSWTVALLNGDGLRSEVGGLPISLIKRQPKDKIEGKQHFNIRRVVNPRDEAIDIDEPAYLRALHLTQTAWEQGKTSHKEKPDAPSGPSLRAERPKARGLLLIYPIDPAPVGSKPGTNKHPVIGWAVSFPGSKTAASITYQVNNIYWAQEFGEGA